MTAKKGHIEATPISDAAKEGIKQISDGEEDVYLIEK